MTYDNGAGNLTNQLKGKRVAILVEDGYQDLEFWVPHLLKVHGVEVISVGLRAGKVCVGKEGVEALVERDATEMLPGDVDAVVIPGGWAPDKLRRSVAILDLVRNVYRNGGIVAMICHGGQVGISAGIVAGERVTGSHGIKDDLINAGGRWSDEGALRSHQLVWAQGTNELTRFCQLLLEALENGEDMKARAEPWKAMAI